MRDRDGGDVRKGLPLQIDITHFTILPGGSAVRMRMVVVVMPSQQYLSIPESSEPEGRCARFVRSSWKRVS